MCHVRINDLLTELLGPYWGIQSPTFFLRKVKSMPSTPNSPVSKSFITWDHSFLNINDFLAIPIHCLVRGSNVCRLFVSGIKVS